ncbi:MAG TPA: hypothetical protein O0W81_02275 [Methanocorpusculum sp.]|nr:hypothetical protein [Methanocorpusculum sp.]
MQQDEIEPQSHIKVTEDVVAYMDKHGEDFRISTTCNGPVLIPIKIKPAKQSDIIIRAGSHVIYVSQHQISWITEINMRLVPQNYYTENDAI